MNDTEDKLYLVRKRIIYHNPDHQLSETIVEVGQVPEGLPFPHLTAADLRLLKKKGILSET